MTVPCYVQYTPHSISYSNFFIHGVKLYMMSYVIQVILTVFYGHQIPVAIRISYFQYHSGSKKTMDACQQDLYQIVHHMVTF